MTTNISRRQLNPTITISEAARKFDSRMMELKPDLTQPQ